jgi:hypothetical protein
VRVQICVQGDAVSPSENEAVLLVHPNGAPAGVISLQAFKSISGRRLQISLDHRRIQYLKFSEQGIFDAGRYFSVAHVMFIEFFEPAIPEFHRHGVCLMEYFMHNMIVHQPPIRRSLSIRAVGAMPAGLCALRCPWERSLESYERIYRGQQYQGQPMFFL